MPLHYRFGLALLAALLTASCAQHATAPEHGPFEGVITAGTTQLPTQATPARIWVTVEPATHTDAAGLIIEVSTEIMVRRPDGSRRAGSVQDLVAGASYRAWHTGIELRSLPPQYFATRIEVW